MREDFNTTHSAHVDRIVKSCDMRLIYNGVEYPFYDNGYGIICIVRSPCYRIPGSVCELLTLKTITKMRAISIRFELINHLMMEYYMPIYHNNVLLSNSPCERCRTLDMFVHWTKLGSMHPRALCEKCYTEEQREGYVRICVSDFRVMDWIQFASTDNHEFHVNCNPGSDEYEQVLHGYQDDYGYHINTVGSVEDFVQLIEQWIACTPSTPEYLTMDELNTFLDSVCTELLVVDRNRVRQTYRHVLENQDAVVGMSEQLISSIRTSVMRYRNDRWTKFSFMFGGKGVIINDLTDEEFEKCVLLEAQEKSKMRRYSYGLISKVNTELWTRLQYKHPEMRSFGTWLLSRNIPGMFIKN